MEKKQEFIVVRNIYLANALAYIGFRYFKYTDEKGLYYTFTDTNDLRFAMKDIQKVRNKYNK